MGSLSSDLLSDARQPEVDSFSHLSSDYEQIFRQIVSIRVMILSNSNLVASRHIKEKKAPFRLA